MWNVLKIVGEVLQSGLVTNIVSAIVGDNKSPAVVGSVNETVSSAARNVNLGNVVQSVLHAIVPNLQTWTTAELSTAQNAWAASQTAPGAITPNSAFAAGVAWALQHQTNTLAAGVSGAVEGATKESVLGEVVKDGVGIATAAATEGVAGAAVTAALDVEQIAESSLHASAPNIEASGPAPSETSAPASK